MAARNSFRSLLTISSILFFCFFIFIASTPFLKRSASSLTQPSPAGKHSDFHAPKKNVWADLSKDEADDVFQFLFKKTDLNLTDASIATSYDNVVMFIEALQPNKTDVLKYLKGDHTAPPPRWAQVVISEGAVEHARIMNYMVGPLPVSSSTEIRPLDYCYNAGRSYVSGSLPGLGDLELWMMTVLSKYSDITTALLGEEFDRDGVAAYPRMSHANNDSLVLWMQFMRQGKRSDATTILPQGLYVKMDLRTRDPENWTLHEWYYRGRIYDSADELRAAMKSPEFQIDLVNLDGEWTDTEDFSEGPSGREIPPPAMIQPQGNRYKIDKEESYVSWMGFEFYLSTSAHTGVSLHDIKFNGDSVIHELGMQEALAHYAGDDPIQGGLLFLDTFFGMGLRMFELVPGYDCPAYATYLPATFHKDGSPISNKNSICIFEYTADYPIQRHTSDFQVSISRNTYLTVRYVSTVGNYDYTIDYTFYLDGTIEVKLRASGFIFGAFWSASNSKTPGEYGYKVHDALATSMHDHVINFKADLDIAGTANTLQRVVVEPYSQGYPWDDHINSPRNSMHLVYQNVTKETPINWPQNSAEMYIVLNEDAENTWGEKRGYRIMAGSGIGTPSHLEILNSTSLKKSSEWAAKDLWVVKQKDTEPMSTHYLNFLSPADPLVDFSKFVDGEDIEQEDLVVYFNLGTHHVPHSGDIPNTLMHISSSSVMFTPFNFHDRDASRRSVQGVKLSLSERGTEANYFGGKAEDNVKVGVEDLEPDMTKYNDPPKKNLTWNLIKAF
ncbi:copper amine oxidase [Xylogone sp. PMI_703]|nr:copper amine oxidase [Xylogone sp. PMI_703]